MRWNILRQLLRRVPRDSRRRRYFDVDTGDALSDVTMPHVFLVVRLDAADIADDPKASFFRAPPDTATNGLGSYCSPPGVAACTTTKTNWRGATFPITVSDDLGAYPIGPAYVDPAKGWDDWVVIEYGYSDTNEGLLRVDDGDAAIGDGPTPFTAYRVGNMPYDDQHRTKTDVGEVLVYDADALSDTEALEVAAHLTRKWMTRPCDATGAIANGGAGDCTTSLAEGESCSPSCDECFVLSGARTCGVGDVLTDTAQCVSTCPSSCCAAKMVEMGLFVPTCCAA